MNVEHYSVEIIITQITANESRGNYRRVIIQIRENV